MKRTKKEKAEKKAAPTTAKPAGAAATTRKPSDASIAQTAPKVKTPGNQTLHLVVLRTEPHFTSAFRKAAFASGMRREGWAENDRALRAIEEAERVAAAELLAAIRGGECERIFQRQCRREKTAVFEFVQAVCLAEDFDRPTAIARVIEAAPVRLDRSLIEHAVDKVFKSKG